MPDSIASRYHALRTEIPDSVEIVLAAKTRTPGEVLEAVSAGARHVGHNYVQEAVAMHEALGDRDDIEWHIIGHVQKNKINKIVSFADMVQTVDSVKSATDLNSRVERSNRPPLPVLLEINSGGEESKRGLAPDLDTIGGVAAEVAGLEHLRLQGVMTMAPFFDDPVRARPFFRETRRIFEALQRHLPTAPLTIVSMGMSDSHQVAIDEGSTMVRLGTIVFGAR